MTSQAPLVSVLIPLYNVERFVERCLNSVFSQTYSALEVIIVNDASRDNSLAITEATIKSNKKEDICIVISHPQNMGLAEARKTAIQKSTGKYLFFLDSDDYWHSSNYIQQCVEKLTECNGQVLIADYIVDYPKKQVYHSQQPASNSGKLCAHALLRGELQGFLHNKCFESENYKRNALEHKQGQNMLEDLRSIFPLFLHTDRIDYLPSPSIHYEQGNENSYIYSIKIDSIKQLFSAIDDCKEYATDLLGPDEFKQDFEIAYLNAAKMLYDKAPYSQYRLIKGHRHLRVEQIASMHYHPLIRYRFRCQLSNSPIVSYVGYLLCRMERSIKRALRN